jgi:hypothetical protein
MTSAPDANTHDPDDLLARDEERSVAPRARGRTAGSPGRSAPRAS